MKTFRFLAHLLDQHMGNGAKPRKSSGWQSRIRRENQERWCACYRRHENWGRQPFACTRTWITVEWITETAVLGPEYINTI